MATAVVVPQQLAMAAIAAAAPPSSLRSSGSPFVSRGSLSYSPHLRFPIAFQRTPRLRCCLRVEEEREEELPTKLQEIVRVFQGVTEPRAKCEQLLHYASKLKPLGEEKKQPENKVEGCVSKVYIACELRAERVYFEAESDVLLTKGLAGLLVEGLSGHTAEEVLKVTPNFVHMLGLKQSLTPSRSNGFLNMLKLIQKKTLQVCSNAGGAVSIPSINAQDDLSETASPKPVGN